MLLAGLNARGSKAKSGDWLSAAGPPDKVGRYGTVAVRSYDSVDISNGTRVPSQLVKPIALVNHTHKEDQ